MASTKIHALNTGMMGVKKRYVHARNTNRLMRLTDVLLDDDFTDIPVYAWVVEHPEGILIVDTGMIAAMIEPEYFPLLQRPYWRSQYRWHITPEDELGYQLRQMGIQPDDVRWAVLTHTHFDHSAGVLQFPKAEFLMSRREYFDVTVFRSAHFGFPSKWPDWFTPKTIDYVPEAVGNFSESYPLTQSGDIRIIPTPGHTPGHQSVLVQSDGLTFLLAGDTSFNRESLLAHQIDAPSFNRHQTFETRERILHLAQQTPLVYMTTHDHQTADYLEAKTLLSSPARVEELVIR